MPAKIRLWSQGVFSAGSWPESLAAFGIIFLIYGLFIYSPYFTVDSYHYLSLGLHPALGDFHPMGMGLILRIMHDLARSVRMPSLMLTLFLALQCLSLSQIVLGPARAIYKVTWSPQGAILAALLFFFWMTLFPGLLLITSGVWSELTYFLLLLVVSKLAASKSISAQNKVGALIVTTIAGYYVRYQFVLVPILLAASTGIGALRKRSTSGIQSGFTQMGGVAFALFAFHAALGSFLPDLGRTHDLTVKGAAYSMECALRCDAHLWSDLDCKVPATRELVLHTFCSEFTLEAVHAGSLIHPARSIFDLMKQIGWVGSLRWIIKAPFLFFQDEDSIWGLEVGAFQFLQNNAKYEYREVAEFYKDGLQNDRGQPSWALSQLIHFLNVVNFEFKYFIYLLGAVVAGAFVVLCLTDSVYERILALWCIATWLMFSYVNAETPIRYLIQATLPGMLALISYFARIAGEEWVVPHGRRNNSGRNR